MTDTEPKNKWSENSKEVQFLLSPEAIRDRANKILELCLNGNGEFAVNLKLLPQVAQFVVQVIKEKYPDLKIPYHTRFNHFNVGGIDREKILEEKLSHLYPTALARTKIDLCVTSVLLDAGSGDNWSYQEGGHMYSRSEGLAVASFNMFMKGEFSSEPKSELRADGAGLIHITEEHIKNGFQVSVSNPLNGTKGRAELLHKLGKATENNKDIFDGGKWTRPGHIVDYLLKKYPNKKVPAKDLLSTVIQGFGTIWPGRIVMNDINMGDTWRHPKLGEGADSFVPFHKLSQWMTYSLLNPLEEVGFEVLNLDQLTGLAEYRNGGLFVDTDVIVPKNDDYKTKQFHPDTQFIIEWRALTIALLDRLAELIRKELGLSAKEFPLAKVLEGGTWWAGRKLAQQKRSGKPPFQIISDGTVF